MKKAISILLLLVMAISLCSTGFAAESTNSAERKVYEETTLGGPIRSVDALVVEFGVEDGKNMMYTVLASRPTATFVAYNLDDKKLEVSLPLQADEKSYTKNSWYIRKGPDGNIYIVPHGYILLYRYNTTTKKLESSGTKPLEGMTAAYGLSFDEEGNIYFGTYPTPNLYRFDKNLKLDKVYENVFPGEKYVMSMVYYDGKIYAGGQAPGTSFISVDVESGEISELKQPTETYGDEMKISSYYMMDIVEHYIFCNVKTEARTTETIVYDIEKGDWVYRHPRAFGYFLPPYKGDGKTYMLAEIPGSENKETGIIEIDLETFSEKDMGTPYYGNLVGCAWLELKDRPDLPGESLVTFSRSQQKLIAFNFEAKKTVVLDEYDLPSVASHIQHLESGLGDTLLMGSYMGDALSVYDPDTGEIVKYKGVQSEVIKRYGSKAYMGGYTQAVLYEYDLEKAPSDENPKLLGSLGTYNQDRIFDLCVIDENLIAVGTYPRSGYDTGGIGIYDRRTGEFTFYDNLFPGQSIDGLAYKDGILYGCTSIYVPVKPYTAEKAYVFAFDMEKREVVKQVEVKIEGAEESNKLYGDIEIGPDGNLWGVTTGAVFCLDPETLETKKSVIGDKMYYDRKTMSTVAQLRFSEDGMLYTVLNGFLTIVDPETMDFYNTRKSAQYFAFGGDGNIYYTGWSTYGNMLKKVKISQLTPAEYDNLENALGDGFLVQKFSNASYVGKEARYISKEDPSITPKIDNGTMLVPDAFLANALGAKLERSENGAQVVFTAEQGTVTVEISSSDVLVNGKKVSVGSKGLCEDTMTWVPLRAICEAMGLTVSAGPGGVVAVTSQCDELSDTLMANARTFIEEDVTAALDGNYMIPEF